MLGTWMQSIALSWLVSNDLNGNGRQLGILGLFQFTPMLLLGAWAGSLADRFDKRRLMIFTQMMLGASALVLAFLDFSNRATLGAVYAVALVSGVASAFDTPVRRALIGDLVPPDIVPNAMSLNTGVITSSRVLGMALGGFVTSWAGTGWCFLVNGVSYLAMLVALRGLGSRAHKAVAAKGSGVRDAVAHVVRTPVLAVSMAVTAVVATFTYNYQVTFPLLIKHVFDRKADALGLLLAVTSVGSFVGAMMSARRRAPSLRLFLVSSVSMGVWACGLAWAPNFLLGALASVPMGVSGGLLMSQLSGLLTLHSPPSMRGRVLALQSVIFLGSTPIGGPIVGWISDARGARAGMAFGGLAALVGGLGGLAWWAARASSRSPTVLADHA